VSDAPRKRGRPAGSRKVHPDRDRLVHFAVEWVIATTGVGLGRGEREPAELNACIIAAWYLRGDAGGKRADDCMRLHPRRSELVVALLSNAELFYEQIASVEEDAAELRRQLRRMTHRLVRNSYQRHQKVLSALPPWKRGPLYRPPYHRQAN
jgi:hypothetical protein